MADFIVVPFKKSTDVDIVKPLKNLLQSACNEDYSEALTELSRLRSAAIWKVFEKSSPELLYSYYDQLVSLESKIPPQEVQIPFKWKDAFDKGSIFGGRMSLTVSSLAYERVCVMFNMAAAQTATAAQLSLDNEDELKLATKLMQQAAGLFQELAGQTPGAVRGEPTPDLSPDVLRALQLAAQAAAQEMLLRKCIRDEMTDAAVAKVAAGGADMCEEAARALGKDAVRHLWDREWLPAMERKARWLRGVAEWRAGAAAGAGGARGEALARLAAAAALLAEAPAGPLRDEARRAAAAAAAAQRDNDFIYHERVPRADELAPVPAARVAQPIAPKHPYSQNFTDLFAGVVPLGTAAALAAAEAARARLAAELVDKLRDHTQLLNSILASLQLPAAAEASAAAGGAGDERLRAAAAAARGPRGVRHVRGLLAELPALLQRNRDVLDETLRMLREEEESDAALRAQFGARWSRTPSAALTGTLRANADKYRHVLDAAAAADLIVRGKLEAHAPALDALMGDESELAASLPAGEAGGADGGGAEAARAGLRALLARAEALRAARAGLEAALRGAGAEAVRAAELAEPGAGPAAAARELAPLRAQVDDSLREQDALVEQLQAGHAALQTALGGRAGAGAARREALSRLYAAHDALAELAGNLEEGTKFYNDLTQLLLAWQSKVSDYAFARRTEKEEWLKDLTQDASRAPAPAPAPAPAHEPAAVRREAPPRPAPPAPAAHAAPAAAALPYPVQPQGMPLPFAPQSAASPYPYCFAPVFPYATLPYPARGGAPYGYPAPAGYPAPHPAPGGYPQQYPPHYPPQ